MSAVVSELRSYPVKSLRGIAHASCSVVERGIAGDRRLMLVDEAGTFMSQRAHPRMALVGTRLDVELLTLEAPGMVALGLAVTGAGPARRVTVWRSPCEGVDQGDLAAEWLTSFLGAPCRLVCMHDEWVRPVDRDRRARPSDQVGFADAAPFLLTTTASLEDLSHRVGEDVPMDRFRPNIVLRGVDAPWAEDDWTRIRIGELDFDIVAPCTRCTIVATDQRTGERGVEPTRTLASFRRIESGKVAFGVYLAHAATGTLSVGDPLELLA